jgi:hypothetical protein
MLHAELKIEPSASDLHHCCPGAPYAKATRQALLRSSVPRAPRSPRVTMAWVKQRGLVTTDDIKGAS